MAKVIMYTTPTCGYCKMAKAYFEENNIEFEEKDVMQDTAAQEEMVKKSNQMGVPVIDVDGEIIIGFDQKKLSELLDIK